MCHFIWLHFRNISAKQRLKLVNSVIALKKKKKERNVISIVKERHGSVRCHKMLSCSTWTLHIYAQMPAFLKEWLF